jgi:hypothetical protein
MIPIQDWLDRTRLGDCRNLLRKMCQDGVQAQTYMASSPYFRLRNHLPGDRPDKEREIRRKACQSQHTVVHDAALVNGVCCALATAVVP